VDSVRAEDLTLGIFLAVVAAIALLIALTARRHRDREGVVLSAGFGVAIGVCALVLCTGWVTILPLPR
jgi:uncharacterized membrane protein YvlD (DUF360 family)